MTSNIQPLKIYFDALALPEHEEYTAGEIHALIEKEKEDFITFEEYAKRRGIEL